MLKVGIRASFKKKKNALAHVRHSGSAIVVTISL
jgi:hypothetical protein